MRPARLALLTATLLATAAPAYAYTDPGSGSLIVQLLFAALFGVLFYVRELVAWLRRFFVKQRPGQPRRPTSPVDDSNLGPLSR